LTIQFAAEQVDHHAGIRQLLLKCFPTAGEADLIEALRTADRLRCAVVATDDSDLVGYVAFSPVTTESGHTGLGLAPLAVHPDYRGQGVARGLVEQGLAASKADACPWVVVLGEPELYGRFGFQPASRFQLVDEYGGGEAFQALELASGTLAAVSGVARYAPEFSMVG
jgi:putative acetyltransferase